ncbi:hypothetical protein MPSEU_000464700 [Mayamaea pseudoterrestris]|nr:hypothetical protein MPSEU_000464700 [Mayamaea pseudoterrestris]
MPEMPERTKSKTRKVLSAVGRPVRGVGRRLGFKRNHSNHFGVIGTNAHLPNANSDAESDSTDTSGLVIRKTYLFGTYSNQYAWLVQKLLEYTAVAWVTSIFILVIGDYYHRKSLEEQDQEPDKLPAAIKSPVDNGETPDTTLDLEAPESEPIPFMPHPALENFFVIDCGPMQRIIPNTNTSYKLETDYFTGEMMLLVRTPDCDDPSAASTPETLATSNYLRDKQRRFEFQFQIRLKKVPTGRVYFACELSEPVKMGIIQRAFVGAAMAFIKTTNNNFHYSLQGASSSDNEKEEKPHMAFPVEEGMNRVVMTPLGEPVPKLGEEIVEDLELYKQRRKGLQIDWKLDHIYTLSLWSAYVDFLDWRCINLPGIRPFQLSNVY